MFVLKALASACVVSVAGLSMPVATFAQAAPPAASAPPAPSAPTTTAPPMPSTTSPHLVLLPYEAPGSTDPHAVAISQALQAELVTDGIAVTSVAPVDHLDAVEENAKKLLADNGASGILIPEGRYEQTKKVIPAPFVTILRYPTHVELPARPGRLRRRRAVEHHQGPR